MNEVIITGNLGSDPEVRNVGQNTVAKFNIASSHKYRGQDGQLHEETSWFPCEYWNPGNVLQYLHKGSSVGIVGDLKEDKWTDQQGRNRSALKVRIGRLELLGSPQQNQGASAPAPQYQQAPQPYQQPAPQGYQQPYQQPAPQGYQQPYQQPAPQGYQPYQQPYQQREVPGDMPASIAGGQPMP